MVKFATSFAALAATFVTALAASETLAQSLTKNATFLAYDEAGWTIAYDGNFTELARYHTPASASVTSLAPISPRAGRCSLLTTSQLKTLAAWPIMEKKARELWGSGSYNLVTNPSEYPGNPATVCVTDNIVKMTLSGNPYCSTSSASTGGTIVGTSGTVTLTFKSSYGSTNSYSVSQTSSLALGVTASASFGIPGIGEGSVETSVEATFTNSIGSSFETKTDSAVEHSITLNAAPVPCASSITPSSRVTRAPRARSHSSLRGGCGSITTSRRTGTINGLSTLRGTRWSRSAAPTRTLRAGSILTRQATITVNAPKSPSSARCSFDFLACSSSLSMLLSLLNTKYMN